jgi:hypothetical protein
MSRRRSSTRPDSAARNSFVSIENDLVGVGVGDVVAVDIGDATADADVDAEDCEADLYVAVDEDVFIVRGFVPIYLFLIADFEWIQSNNLTVYQSTRMMTRRRLDDYACPSINQSILD